MPARLANKVALITGAPRGIGLATALAFARAGASVVVHYVSNRDAAAEVVKHITTAGRPAFAFQADIADRSQVQALVQQTLG